MPSRIPPIARIRLARSPLRLVAVPALLVASGTGLTVAAVLGPMRLMQPAWIALVAAAAVVALFGLFIAIRLLSVRLDVEEAAVRVRWLGGERVHALTPGPVTRVRLRGEHASSLRSRTGWLGWTLGRATLRGEESIQVVRLAKTATAILVPTEEGRLAIAAASETDLIEALSRAARARQRLEQLARTAPPALEPGSAPDEAPPDGPHALTGIERAELEEHLAREREALTAEPAAGAQAAVDGEGAVPPAPTPDAVEAPATGRRPRGRATTRLGRPRPSAAFVLLPLVGSGIVWGLATVGDRLPDAGTDLGRLTSLGLVLAGPATSVGAIMARAWWPRLVGVVVTSGLAAAVFVGRALLGP
ncbi:MAG TPA: hypothetical protein VF365_11700 [Candidatus Limnocylindria bacterium]